MKLIRNIILVTIASFLTMIPVYKVNAAAAPALSLNDCLLDACKDGKDAKVVQDIIKKGVNINAKDNCGYTPLYYACWHGHTEVVKELILAGADVSAKNRLGDTLLHTACWYGYVDIINMLIAAGADVCAGNYRNATPLHFACLCGHIEVVKILLKKGVFVNVKTDTEGNTPLHDACSRGYIKVVEVLLNAGADKTAKNWQGHTPRDLAALNSYEEIVRIL